MQMRAFKPLSLMNRNRGVFGLMILAPLIYVSNKSLYTLPLTIAALRGYADGFLWGPMMAASAASVVPVLAVYLLAQRYFIEGITLTGMKG